MENRNTIVALSTPALMAALAVVRMSGPDAIGIAEAMFSRRLGDVAGGTALHGILSDGTEPVDEVILTVFRAPASYTGEDTVEISCHGSMVIVRRILELAQKHGARQARAGEFTKRAFVNGKLDLVEAEAVIDLIEAETGAEAEAAFSSVRGTLSKEVEQVRDNLLNLAAQLLAYVDYPDDGIEDLSSEQLREILRQMGKIRPEDELNCGTCGYNTCREKAIAVFQGKAEVSMCLPYLKEKAESFSDSIVKNTPNGIIVLNEKLEVQQINEAARKIVNIRKDTDILGDQVVRILDPADFVKVLETGRNLKDHRSYLAEYDRYVEQTIVYDKEYHLLVGILRDVTEEESVREQKESISRQTVEIADKVVDKQMRIVQEIASLLGETAAETKIALTKLKESIADE